eukprot:NODE_135_length_16508_cov_1.365897.p17 type:complete len:109 gc:universal NODE_135_length_16508_cov_1.365897:1546-1872(+)
MKILTTNGIVAYMRKAPSIPLDLTKLQQRIKNHKLDTSNSELMAEIKDLRKTHSVQQLAKKYKCSPLAISMVAPKKGAALQLEKEQWQRSSYAQQLVKIRKYQRKAMW